MGSVYIYIISGESISVEGNVLVMQLTIEIVLLQDDLHSAGWRWRFEKEVWEMSGRIKRERFKQQWRVAVNDYEGEVSIFGEKEEKRN